MAEPRRVGRKPLPEALRRETLRVSVTRAEYDVLCRAAVRRGVSLSDAVMLAIRAYFSEKKSTGQ